ncbi:hypothetical protein KI387_000085, partial [Taxus chinensis]
TNTKLGNVFSFVGDTPETEGTRSVVEYPTIVKQDIEFNCPTEKRGFKSPFDRAFSFPTDKGSSPPAEKGFGCPVDKGFSPVANKGFGCPGEACIHGGIGNELLGLLKLLQSEVESLMNLNGEQLKILYADMLDYHCIVDALNGCCGLFYTFDPPQYDEMMVEVEVRASHNVLEACAHTETHQKVVFTSSVAVVAWRDDKNLVVDLHERHWSDVNLCRRLKLWYALCKTLSKKTTWDLAMDKGVNMVIINTGLVVGPGSAYKTSRSTIAYLK